MGQKWGTQGWIGAPTEDPCEEIDTLHNSRLCCIFWRRRKLKTRFCREKNAGTKTRFCRKKNAGTKATVGGGHCWGLLIQGVGVPRVRERPPCFLAVLSFLI